MIVLFCVPSVKSSVFILTQNENGNALFSSKKAGFSFFARAIYGILSKMT